MPLAGQLRRVGRHDFRHLESTGRGRHIERPERGRAYTGAHAPLPPEAPPDAPHRPSRRRAARPGEHAGGVRRGGGALANRHARAGRSPLPGRRAGGVPRPHGAALHRRRGAHRRAAAGRSWRRLDAGHPLLAATVGGPIPSADEGSGSHLPRGAPGLPRSAAQRGGQGRGAGGRGGGRLAAAQRAGGGSGLPGERAGPARRAAGGGRCPRSATSTRATRSPSWCWRSSPAPSRPTTGRYQVLDMPLDYGEVRLVDPPFLEATQRLGPLGERLDGRRRAHHARRWSRWASEAS